MNRENLLLLKLYERDTIAGQSQNRLSGLASWITKKRKAAQSGFFMRHVFSSMMGCVGASPEAPVSFFVRLRQPCAVYHHRLVSVVMDSHKKKESNYDR